jgi:membrane-bound lytic murein transglycosylase MltF
MEFFWRDEVGASSLCATVGRIMLSLACFCVVSGSPALAQKQAKKLAAEKKLKSKHLKVRVVFIPLRRDQLLPGLAAGKGDIAAANLTITPERRKLVDFSVAGLSNVSEVLVTGPASPKIASLDDLSGKEVFVRKSSSYYQSLVELNKKFAAGRKPPVRLKEAPETLEDEDLLEMLNAGLVALIVVDKHKADFWKQIFPKLIVHDSITVRTGGEVAWAIRKGSPQLKAVVDDFKRRHKVGTATGNQLLTRYLKNVKYVKNAASEEDRKKFMALIQYFRKYGEKYDVDCLLMGAQGYQATLPTA